MSNSSIYAANTSVSVEKTRGEIESLLSKYGATGFQYGWRDALAQVDFVVKDRHVRFTLRLPDRDDKRFTRSPGGKKILGPDARYKAWEQSCRSLWRALLLAIKAKLESVQVGISEFDQEFFAFIVDPVTNRTIYQAMKPAIEARYEGRDVPLALPAPEEFE